MLKNVTLKNVGPLPDVTVDLGNRLTIFTGDNGLGKSFFLDILWYVLTRRWPAEVNPQLNCGYMARPHDPRQQAFMTFNLETSQGHAISNYEVSFNRQEQTWQGKAGRPYSAGLVIYAHADGSFSAWDPARNYWLKKGNMDFQDREPAFVLSPDELWNGLKNQNGKTLCNGLLQDWNLWQSNPNAWEFSILESLLEKISPPEWPLKAGKPTRVTVDDSRDIPTITMQYGDVPVLWASAGIRRMLAFAYFLTWSLSEHIKACKLLGTNPTPQVTFLMDEVEAHLHPKWQRVIMGGILDVLDKIPQIFSKKKIDDLQNLGPEWKGRRKNRIQIVAATHSPLIMASLEECFDAKQDKWYDLDVQQKNRISLEQRPFIHQGTTDQWLQSQAFDLTSTYSLKTEKAIKKAAELCKQPNHSDDDFKEVYATLVKLLNPLDRHLFLFRAYCEKQGIQYQ